MLTTQYQFLKRTLKLPLNFIQLKKFEIEAFIAMSVSLAGSAC